LIGAGGAGEVVASSRRRPDIQGLRAIAILFVVGFHAGLPMPGGFLGVDVFFVISGFVITRMLARRHEATGALRLREFYARRIRRLTPALALMVGCVVLFSFFALSPLQGQEDAAKTAVGAMLLFANGVISQTTGGYFDPAADTNPLLHTWSLSVEEQFYLVFPIVLLVGWKLSRRFPPLRSGPLLATAGIGAGSFVFAVVSSRGYQLPHDAFAHFYSPFTRAWEFAAGAMLVLVGARSSIHLRQVETVLPYLGIALLGASLWLVTGQGSLPDQATLIPVIGALLIIRGGSRGNGLVTRTLGSRPLVAVGDLSYSWYLWHWPLIVFTTLLWGSQTFARTIAAAASLIPATVSYRWVEQPIRRGRDVSGRRMAGIVAFCLLPPIALAGSLWVAVDAGFWSSKVRALSAAVRPLHAAAVAGCTTGDVREQLAGKKCEWISGARGRPVYVVGDSNADQYSEAVIGAGALLRRPVTISTFNGCAFIGASWSDESGAFKERCRGYVTGTLGWLKAAKRGVVIIAVSDSLWTDMSIAAGPTRGTETTDRRKKVTYLQADLRSVVEQLKRAGQAVLLVQPIPKPQRVHDGRIEVLFDPSRCSTWAVVQGHCPQPVNTPESYADRIQADPLTTIRRVATQTGAKVLDIRGRFCPHHTCSTHRGQLLLYRDGGHITVRTSQTLAPTFAVAMRHGQ
jgi:peptidoglycan/LPS O-acetylase OafA/YrhL